MAFLLAGCATPSSPSAPASSHATPSGTSIPVSGTTPTSAPSGAPGPATLVHCSASVPAGRNLVIGTVAGTDTVVVRDITDTSAAQNLCSFDSGAQNPQFVTATQVAYTTAAGQLIKADLTTGATTLVVASFGPGFGVGSYSWQPNNPEEMTYTGTDGWHLKTAAGDHVLSTLPPVPGRGVNPDEDDYFLSFSNDSQYIGLVQTFQTGGSGATAPVQVRRASDGSLVYSTSDVTMGVWAALPSRLFYRDNLGAMKRWDPSAGQSDMLAIHWIHPKSSPDGRWIAYYFRSPSGIGGVAFYSVQGNSVSNTSPPGRTGVRFLNNNLVWYQGERPCTEADNCGLGGPILTGQTFIYDIGGAAESPSRLTSVLDAWPHVSSPAG